jgi:hypothetical protein
MKGEFGVLLSNVGIAVQGFLWSFKALERSVRIGTVRRAVQRDGAVTYALTSEGWKRRQLRHRLASSPSDQQLEGRQGS